MGWTPSVLVAAGVMGLGLLAGCGSGTPTGVGGPTVTVTLSEFDMTANPTSIPPGGVFFAALNAGKVVHEVVVLKTDRAADSLPLNGSRVDESASGIQHVGEIENVQPGSGDGRRIELQPGRYVLICNIAGHYQPGMRAALRVP